MKLGKQEINITSFEAQYGSKGDGYRLSSTFKHESNWCYLFKYIESKEFFTLMFQNEQFQGKLNHQESLNLLNQ
jgi:hypothetical protein